MTTTTLDYLRHGQPLGGSRFRGNGVDDPLSELGWSQMQTTCATIDGWQQVISSPMQRCLAFAQNIAMERSLPLTVIDDLREVGFGNWEGVNRDQLKQHRRAEYQAFYRDPVRNRPPGAESLIDFGQRIARVFDRLVDEFSGQHLLVVSHAGVIRATLGHVSQSPATTWYRAAVANAAVSRFTRDARGTALIAHNWRPTL